MVKDVRFPNDKVECTYETETVVIKYTPYEKLHLRDFVKLWLEFKKITKILLRE